MARKSARAIAAAGAAQSTHSDKQTPTNPGKVSLSELSPKSCLTCGRVITPRAKWAKDWSGIKYCSDRCRSTRPGKVVVRFSSSGDLSTFGRTAGVKVEDQEVTVDVEMFVEATLLDVAGKKEATLEHVQDQIRASLIDASIAVGQAQEGSTAGSNFDSDAEAKEMNGPTKDNNDHIHPLWKALDSPPGLRERIRRAARRMALGVTHESDPKQTNIVTTENGCIELLQGRKPLRTVEELSFAKGVLHIRRK